MTDGDVNEARVMAYMCNLTNHVGMEPTQEEAESFSRRERTLITPKDAIKILGVNRWEEVVQAYKKSFKRERSANKRDRDKK